MLKTAFMGNTRINKIQPKYEYVSDVGQTLYDNSWVAPEDGIIVIHGVANNSGGDAYWYVVDTALTDMILATLYWPSANQTHRTACFPVIKGHTYNSTAKKAIYSVNGRFYKLVI